MLPKQTYSIPSLPPPGLIETNAVLRAAAVAHRRLGELKGKAGVIPNQGILIDTFALQEALASSEIENIVTTQDEMFQATIFPEGPSKGAAKEVALYSDALRCGFTKMVEQRGLLTNNIIIEMFRVLKRSQEGFRKTPGTALKNHSTGEIVYVPPQEAAKVISQMTALERFINDDAMSALDPLVKMAIIHHQFESIHPFSDGNRRIGRIVNVLYLTRVGLLEIPILYLSRYINTQRADYYRLLQAVRDDGAWEKWLLFMLEGVAETASQGLILIEGIAVLMADYKHRIREHHPKLYSQDLLNNLFRHPYTRIEFVQNDLGVARQTASRYLDELASAGFVRKHVSGRNNYYINKPLADLFLTVSRLPTDRGDVRNRRGVSKTTARKSRR
jgi:Fic family protein